MGMSAAMLVANIWPVPFLSSAGAQAAWEAIGLATLAVDLHATYTFMHQATNPILYVFEGRVQDVLLMLSYLADD